MPTWDKTERFQKDWAELGTGEREAFRAAVVKMVEDLRAGRGFRKGLRIKGVKQADGVYEMTWASDGRATFQYGSPRAPGEAHIIWRRIGTHEIFGNP